MLGKYGARVACNDIRKEAAEATQRRLERNGCTAMSVVGDVTVRPVASVTVTASE